MFLFINCSLPLKHGGSLSFSAQAFGAATGASSWPTAGADDRIGGAALVFLRLLDLTAHLE